MIFSTLLRACWLSLAVVLASGVVPARAQEALQEERDFLRIRLDGREIRLEAMVVRPVTTQGRLPLALITHGRTSSTVSMGELRAARYATLARDLARRGWLAAVVMRRGAGQSDGPLPSAISCAHLDMAARFKMDADELEAALRVLQGRQDVDPQRVILLGESAGGAAAMTLASRKPPGLRGVINVAGGLNLESCVEKGRDALVASVRSWQVPAPAPQLWVYARNDELFPPVLVDRMRSAALDGGGDIRFVDLPEIKPRGHLIFVHGLARHLWLREMDISLRAWGLPTVPADRGRSFHARLGLTTRVEVFERYFSAPGEKAMALSRSKKDFTYWFGTDALDAARTNALASCAKIASDCVVAFENDRLLLAD